MQREKYAYNGPILFCEVEAMKIMGPDYYPEFVCIAGDCKHTCCAGWEIDVDEDSFARYQALEGAVGEKVRSRISTEDEVPHYRMGPGNRCPFLQENGLCEMILELGEDALCQICADHPRFRNFFGDRTEIGLGLCCEAAGRLILTREEPVRLIPVGEEDTPTEEDPEEQALLSFRDMLFEIMQDRSCTLDERLTELAETCGGMPERPISRWAAAFATLERLDEGWTDCLEALEREDWDEKALCTPEWDRAFEQAGVYFLYRHLPAALEDGDLGSKGAFAVLSVKLLRALCAVRLRRTGSVTPEDLVEYARMYSGEVEYSEENLEQIFAWLAAE